MRFTGSVEEGLLSITSVHPMRKEAVREFLRKVYSDWNIIEKLLHGGKLVNVNYEGTTYYMWSMHSWLLN